MALKSALTKVEIKKGKDTSYFVIMYTVFYFELKERNKVLTLSLAAENWLGSTKKGKIDLEFRDLKESPLEEQVGDIIYQMFVVGNRLYAKYKIEELVQGRNGKERGN
ncbi:hypothetical protein J8TS2_42150 [Lederbergia ruris]|uniref:Arm DNA-binding domain-containing protein n=1 Tax=Lederbergia ruris TaxID=217495 RepID=A0ABQ4KQX2_9BACI|nr:hypothetical protein [Lederbergia ruris]GIN59896.1 hypothetical protein J8TS2_42150 [Lederbergia ruris]